MIFSWQPGTPDTAEDYSLRNFVSRPVSSATLCQATMMWREIPVSKEVTHARDGKELSRGRVGSNTKRKKVYG